MACRGSATIPGGPREVRSIFFVPESEAKYLMGYLLSILPSKQANNTAGTTFIFGNCIPLQKYGVCVQNMSGQ